MAEDIAQAQNGTKLQAAAFAEATVYSMNNNYLTRVQKACVEGIYQFPLGVFDYSLLSMLALGKQDSYLEAFLVAAFVNICFALTIWVEASVSFAKLGFLFGGIVNSLFCVSLAAYMAYQSNWIGAAVGIAAALGVLSFLSPSM